MWNSAHRMWCGRYLDGTVGGTGGNSAQLRLETGAGAPAAQKVARRALAGAAWAEHRAVTRWRLSRLVVGVTDHLFILIWNFTGFVA